MKARVRKAHPIERALAMQKLHSLLTTEKIRVYLMERGEPCADRGGCGAQPHVRSGTQVAGLNNLIKGE